MDNVFFGFAFLCVYVCFNNLRCRQGGLNPNLQAYTAYAYTDSYNFFYDIAHFFQK